MNQPLRILLVESRTGGEPERVAGVIEELRRRFPNFDVTAVSDSAVSRRHGLTEMEEGYLSVGRVARGVAHDLNNDLTAVFGYTALAKEALPKDHPAAKPLEMVERAALQANMATRALLSFGLPSSPERRILDLRAATADAARLLRRLLPGSAAVEMDDEGPAIWVDADGTQILQAILSLGLIALDAFPREAELEIKIHVDSDSDRSASVDLSVSTHASPGVVATARTASIAEMPGLSAVARITEEHGGRLEITNPGDERAMFRIVLPMVRHDERTAQRTRGSGVKGGGGLILLAEAHDYLREIAACALRTAGYEVLAATDGPGLLELYSKQKRRVSLIVLEQDLPAKTGLECLKKIRADGSETPTIVISESTRPRLDARTSSKAYCLSKPFQTSELLELVHSLIHGAPKRAER